ncbi:hypothetical protein NRE35_004239 [Salmonella enterica]|nr:hypothetical protein [Escherichia coli]EJO2543873.1 hypothetical protein [Salmonella enterica]
MKPSSAAKALTRKGSKLMGRGDREDVLLDTIVLTYSGIRLNDDVALGRNCYEHVYKVTGRVDVTDFICPETGRVKVEIEFLTTSVKGFAEYVERYFQDRPVVAISLGLRGDKYKVEWRKKRSGEVKGFERSALSKAINPENK